jgi:hypothetical protein
MIFIKNNKRIILIATVVLVLIVTSIVVTIKASSNLNSEENTIAADKVEIDDNTEDICDNKDSNCKNEEDKKVEEASSAEGQTSINKPTEITKNTESKKNQSGEALAKQQPKSETNVTNTNVNSNETVTIQGFLIDEDCFICYPDPAKETLGCLIMPECAASGYGIAFLSEGKYQFYFFDGAISTYANGKRNNNATGGQQIAWDYINNNIETNNIPVKVTGQLTKETRTNPDSATADNKYYKVFKVSSINQ